MRMDKHQCLKEVLDCIENEKQIPFALERAASHYDININQVKEVMEDMNEKVSSEAEHWITGESWSEWSDWSAEIWPEES